MSVKKRAGIRMDPPPPPLIKEFLSEIEQAKHIDAIDAWRREALKAVHSRFDEIVEEIANQEKIAKTHPNYWRLIAFNLIKQTGALKVTTKRPGKKQGWNWRTQGRLYRKVREIRKRAKCSIFLACTELAKLQWNGIRVDPRALENQYTDAAKSEFVLHMLDLEKREPELAEELWSLWTDEEYLFDS